MTERVRKVRENAGLKFDPKLSLEMRQAIFQTSTVFKWCTVSADITVFIRGEAFSKRKNS